MKYILGLDQGSQSLGWCILETDLNGDAKRLVDGGVRIFDDGRDAQSHQPLGVARRLAKQTARRRKRAFMRRQALLKLLKQTGFLPEEPKKAAQLSRLDPYKLRKRGIQTELTKHEIGRLLLHLSKRRGFKSSRKGGSENDDDSNGLKRGIENLNQILLGGETLGSLLADRRDEEPHKAIRFRPATIGVGKTEWEFYPSREMYRQELEKILLHQSQYHPEITDELRQRLNRIILEQRPLRKPRVGNCRYFPDENRLASALPSIQRMRIYQEVNNLRIIFGDTEAPLQPAQRSTIIEHLTLIAKKPAIRKKDGIVTWKKMRQAIGLSANESRFNTEEIGREGLQADLTAISMASSKRFGAGWFDLDLQQQDQIIEKIVGSEDKPEQDTEEEITAWLVNEFGLTEANATECVFAPLPDGFARLGRSATTKLLPILESGAPYMSALQETGLVDFSTEHELLPALPYYGEILESATMPTATEGGNTDEAKYGKIPNPTVHVALNQLRRLVNAIISEYGRPEVIRIELARDLSKGAEQRKETTRRNAENRRQNSRLRDEVAKAGGNPRSKDDLDRMKLWEELCECPEGRCCPFTGQTITPRMLFDSQGSVEIEHLLPFSRTFDDSLANKTVCLRSANREKREQTPFEAFGESPEWEQILTRSEHLRENKRWRFRANAMEKFMKDHGDLIARTLNDTRYLSRITQQYLSAVAPKVETVRGGMTAALRDYWGLNRLLNDVNSKQRDDHRHHFIDAFVVSATTPIFLNRFQHHILQCREERPDVNPLKLRNFPQPFDGYSRDSVEYMLQHMVVSHRQEQKRAGSGPHSDRTPGDLHNTTFYGMDSVDGETMVLKRRIPLNDLKISDVGKIASNSLRERLSELAADCTTDAEWKEAIAIFATDNRIRRLRILERFNKGSITSFDGRDGKPYRFAKTDGNAWLDIYDIRREKNEKPRWQMDTVSLIEAARSDGQPRWKREYPWAKKVARLFINDCVAFRDTDGHYRLYRVKKTRGGRFYARDLRIAREEKDKSSVSCSASAMLARGFVKVSVDILGRLKAPEFVRENLYVGPIYRD